MHTRRLRWTGLAATSAVLVSLACSSATSSGPQPPAGSGQLVVNLVDAPNPQVDQIVVNVTQVTAHSTSAGWVVVQAFATPLPLDLLQLRDASAQLGLANLPPGSITQIRLYVAQDGNYVVAHGQTAHQDLKVPSGYQSGIKIHGPWEITECNRTAVTLDFDGEHSIHYGENGTSLWVLRPVIRVKKAEAVPVGCGGDGETDGGTGGEGGGACSEATPCPEGQRCQAGVCLGGTGGSCTGDTQCASGICDTTQGQCGLGGPGTPCRLSGDCLSGTCTEAGTCGQSPPSGACRDSSDCAGGTCQDGSCAGCAADADCAALTCGEAACTCSVEGALCIQAYSW